MAGNGDPAVGRVAGDHVAGHQVAVRGPGVVAQQHPTGVEGDEIPLDLRISDAGEVNALAAVAGHRSHCLALEVGSVRDAEAEVVVHHGAVADRDAGELTAQPRGQDALALGVGDLEAAEPDAGADHHHGGVDGLHAQTRQGQLECRGDAGFVNGRPPALQRHRLGDDDLLVISAGADHHGAPRAGGVDGARRRGSCGDRHDRR